VANKGACLVKMPSDTVCIVDAGRQASNCGRVLGNRSEKIAVSITFPTMFLREKEKTTRKTRAR